MQIQVKQSEIVAALKQYIANQGINLTGKDVVITFTAGRKESGLTADISIEDVSIPGFSQDDVDTALKGADAPALTLVATLPAKTEPETSPAPATDGSDDAPTAETPQPEPAPAKTTSLFGG